MKSRKPIRHQLSVPRSVLVFREKHGSRYFHIPNAKALYAAALQVLTMRYREECWYLKPEPSDKPKTPDVPAAEIEKLPVSLQSAARTLWQEYNERLRSYLEDERDYKAITKAVREKDGKAAWDILNARKNAEYEGFFLESYEN